MREESETYVARASLNVKWLIYMLRKFIFMLEPSPRTTLRRKNERDLAIALTSSRDNWLSWSLSISLNTFAVGGESLILMSSTSNNKVAPAIRNNATLSKFHRTICFIILIHIRIFLDYLTTRKYLNTRNHSY